MLAAVLMALLQVCAYTLALLARGKLSDPLHSGQFLHHPRRPRVAWSKDFQFEDYLAR